MVNGVFNFLAAVRDLAFQRDNPRLQLGHGKPVEILAHQLGKRVVRTQGGVVKLHDRQR